MTNQQLAEELQKPFISRNLGWEGGAVAILQRWLVGFPLITQKQ